MIDGAADLVGVLGHPALPVLTFLLGALIGHRTALWRDRRRDFNAAAEPVRAWLLAELDRPSAGRAGPGLAEFDRLVSFCPLVRRRRLRNAWRRLQHERQQAGQRDAYGQVTPVVTPRLTAALRTCLRLTRPM